MILELLARCETGTVGNSRSVHDKPRNRRKGAGNREQPPEGGETEPLRRDDAAARTGFQARKPSDRRHHGRFRVHHLRHRHLGQHANPTRGPTLSARSAKPLDIYPRCQGNPGHERHGRLYVSELPRSVDSRLSASAAGAITTRLATWAPYSNSSPVEGHRARPSRPSGRQTKRSASTCSETISRRGTCIESVVDRGGHHERRGASGRQPPSPHPRRGVSASSSTSTAKRLRGFRYAALMRELASRNNGTFVGLPSLQ